MKRHFYRLSLTIAIILITLVAGKDSATEEESSPVGFEISHHHVGISVEDAGESAAWYNRMLGFKVVTRMEQQGMTVVHIQRGNCYIELFQVDGAKPLPEYRRDPTMDLGVHGTVHFAFQVKDVSAAIMELKAKGAEIAMEPVETPGVAFAFIRDNSGNCFEIIQYKQ